MGAGSDSPWWPWLPYQLQTLLQGHPGAPGLQLLGRHWEEHLRCGTGTAPSCSYILSYQLEPQS